LRIPKIIDIGFPGSYPIPFVKVENTGTEFSKTFSEVITLVPTILFPSKNSDFITNVQARNIKGVNRIGCITSIKRK